MLFINPLSPKLIRAKRMFHNNMLDLLLKRIDSIDSVMSIDNKRAVVSFFDNHVNDRLDDILIGLPHRLLSVHSEIDSFVAISSDIKKGIQHVFNYNWFIEKRQERYDAYHLADSLDIRTCTYCNRNYTNTVITRSGKKITRPQFDHFFDKDSHPVLALSFYNLIPSCSICNSGIKGKATMNLTQYLHPYIDNEIEQIKFSYKYSVGSNNGLLVRVESPNGSKAKNTVNLFAIEEVYNSHTGELLDLLKTKQYFSDRYLSILNASLLRDVIVSKNDIYRIVFGTELNSVDFLNRPFSKFKSDILKELGII